MCVLTRVAAGCMQLDEVSFLPWGELGLLAAQPAIDGWNQRCPPFALAKEADTIPAICEVE